MVCGTSSHMKSTSFDESTHLQNLNNNFFFARYSLSCKRGSFFGLKHLCSAVFPSACKKYRAKSSPRVNNCQKYSKKYENGISKGDGMEEG